MPSRKRRCKDLILLTDMDGRDTQSLLTSFVKLRFRDTSSLPLPPQEETPSHMFIDWQIQRSVGHMHASKTTQTLTEDASCEMCWEIFLYPELVRFTSLISWPQRPNGSSCILWAGQCSHQLRNAVSKYKNRIKCPLSLSNTFHSTQHLTSFLCTLIPKLLNLDGLCA